jgi:hypothetical protein
MGGFPTLGVPSPNRDEVPRVLITSAHNSSAGGELDESGLNFMLSVVKAIEPKDEVETIDSGES